jgi:hypothetical protein
VDFIMLDTPENPDSLLLEVKLTGGTPHELKIDFPKTFLK